MRSHKSSVIKPKTQAHQLIYLQTYYSLKCCRAALSPPSTATAIRDVCGGTAKPQPDVIVKDPQQ